jgi:hypothetical protein
MEIEKEKVQQLLDNFYRVCSMCDELDIYEHDSMDESMQEMHEWVDENFGRKIE